MTEQDRILISILAATDAVWRPMRRADWAAPAPTNLHEARRRFPTAGVSISTGAVAEAQRKAKQRIVADLAASGLLVLYGGTRRLGVKLTPAAEIGLRSLCGLPNIGEAHQMLRRVIELSAKTDDGQSLCREYWLAGLKNYTPNCSVKLLDVQEQLAPALLRGWVESRSDMHGRVCYYATAAGCEAATEPPPVMSDGLPEYSDQANEFFYAATRLARNALRTDKPTNPSEIGYIPLSASIDLRRPRGRKAKAKK